MSHTSFREAFLSQVRELLELPPPLSAMMPNDEMRVCRLRNLSKHDAPDLLPLALLALTELLTEPAIPHQPQPLAAPSTEPPTTKPT